MSLTKYDEEIINNYNKYLLEYFNKTDNLSNITNSKNRDLIIIKGFNTFLHVLSILYTVKMNDDQISSYLEKCPLLFIEYTEQVYLKKTDITHTPTMFVYNVLLGNINMQDYNCDNNNTFMKKFMKWSQIIYFWENKNLTLDNRKYFSKNYLQPYLLLFTQESFFSLYSIFENLQSSLLNHVNIFEKYSYLLTSFLKYFQKKNTFVISNNMKTIHFDKFMREKDKYDEKINNITNLKDMDELIQWIFSN